MKRLLWLIFAGLAIAAAALVWRDGTEKGSIAAAAPLAAPALERQVRVKHELVTAIVPTVSEEPESRAHAVPRVHTGKPAFRRATRDSAPNLLQRAGRAIVGDGTYRPEPFPRIRN
jgi:hypothetical protein